jgi:hypothetical protein
MNSGRKNHFPNVRNLPPIAAPKSSGLERRSPAGDKASWFGNGNPIGLWQVKPQAAL